MMAYPGLTPRIIDEEMTPGQIVDLLSCWEEQQPSMFQLHRLNCQIEAIICAFTGGDSSNKEKPTGCAEYEWSKFGHVEELWDGC